MQFDRRPVREKISNFKPGPLAGRIAKLDKATKFLNKLKHADSSAVPEALLKEESSLNLEQYSEQLVTILVKSKKQTEELFYLMVQLAVRACRQYPDSSEKLFNLLDENTELENAYFLAELLVVLRRPAQPLRKYLSRRIMTGRLKQNLQFFSSMVERYGPQFFRTSEVRSYEISQQDYVKIYQLVWNLVSSANTEITSKHKVLQKEQSRMAKLQEKCGGVIPQKDIDRWNELCAEFTQFSAQASRLGLLLSGSMQQVAVQPPVKEESASKAEPKQEDDEQYILYNELLDLREKVPETALEGPGLAATGQGFLTIDQIESKLKECTNVYEADNLSAQMALVSSPANRDKYLAAVLNDKGNRFAIRTIANLNQYWPELSQKLEGLVVPLLQEGKGVERAATAKLYKQLMLFRLVEQTKTVSLLRKMSEVLTQDSVDVLEILLDRWQPEDKTQSQRLLNLFSKLKEESGLLDEKLRGRVLKLAGSHQQM